MVLQVSSKVVVGAFAGINISGSESAGVGAAKRSTERKT